jgi:hypothetical protein
MIHRRPAVSGAQVVHYKRLKRASGQNLSGVAADVASAAGDENVYHEIPSTIALPILKPDLVFTKHCCQ